jgi:SMC interacting uncharacterized protein involved in chromosome segregation
MQTKTLSERIEELQAQNKSWQEALVTRLCEFGEEKDELLAKNRKFEKELFEGNLAYLELLAKNKDLQEERVLIRPEELLKVQKHFNIFYLNRLQFLGRVLEDQKLLKAH